MKKIKIFILMLLAATTSFSQVPQAIKYQVVVRDNNGIPVVNKAVGLKISILRNGINGPLAYSEEHSASTNSFGLINISIGTGDSVYKDFEDLLWKSHEYFVKVEVDTAGGTNYAVLGTSQLVTVPYSFYSDHSKSSDILMMTTAEQNAIQNPYPGMQLINIDDKCLHYYLGNSWERICKFICGVDVLVDQRDGKIYPTVQIGTQCWMSRNLNIGVYVASVSTGSSHSDVSNNGIIEKYCYGNNTDNCDIYGGLYDWDEMMDYVTSPGVQGICPPGWHIPTDAEWCTLTTYLDAGVNCNTWGGSGTIAGGKMKETGTEHWYTPNTGATNSSGFTALGAGSRYTNGYFNNLTYGAIFWSSSEYSSTYGINRNLYYYYANVYRYYYSKTYGFSVRCLRTN